MFTSNSGRQFYKENHMGKQLTLNSQSESNKITNYQPAEKLLKKFTNKINVEKYEGPQLPVNVANHLIESNRRFEADRWFAPLLSRINITDNFFQNSDVQLQH